jgi:uncharacterized membrane protein YqjE
MIDPILKAIDTSLAAVQHRFELLAIEFQEEKSRFIELLLWATLALFAGVMGVIVATITIVFLFDENHRGYAAIAFSFLYLIGATWALNEVRSRLKNAPLPLLGSISELKKDREFLKK